MKLNPLPHSLIAGLALGLAMPGNTVARDDRPNIVLIVADDLGYGDLSSYGSPSIRTPVIDSIGREGIRLTQFYVSSPECSPSRAGLLTGRYPQRVGGLECAIGTGNVGRYDEAIWLRERNRLGLPATESTIARTLAEAGYATAVVGKWHLGYETEFQPRHHGFAESLVVISGGVDYFSHRPASGEHNLYHNGKVARAIDYLTDVFTDHALEWITQPRTRPYFLYLPYTAPHSPFQGPGDGPIPADSPLWKQGAAPPATYRAMIEHMDKRIGDLLAAIERTSAADNTIVVFLSDNGATTSGSNAPFRGTKSRLWEGGIRVPCLIRWTAKIPAGQETHQVATSLDLTATLLAAARIKSSANHPLDGIDLTATLTGQQAPFPRTMFWRYKRGDSRRHAVRRGELKYVVQEGLAELFDLASDPGENRNLLPARRDTAIEMEALYRSWERSVYAPRMHDFPGETSSPAVPGLTAARR